MALIFENKGVFHNPPNPEKYERTIDVYNAVIHPQLENKFIRDNLDEERRKAEVMTEGFSIIKQAIIEGEQKGAVVFPPELINYLKNRGVFGTNPYRIGKYSGQAFEEDLVAIINAVMTQRVQGRQTKGREREQVAYRVGGYQAKPDLTTVIETDLTGLAQDLISEAESKVTEHKSVQSIKHRVVKRSGLIDVRVNKSSVISEFAIEWPGLEEFWQALNGAQFSAKNYQLKTILDKHIFLGAADDYKKIGGALNFVLDNPGQEDVEKVFFASKQSRDRQAVDEHLRHLIAIYELAGAGQIYFKKGTNKVANFGGIANYLIVNINTGNRPIKVFSVRALIQDYVMGIQKGYNKNYTAKIVVGDKSTSLQWNPDDTI